MIIPRPDEQIAIHEIYVNELINGVFAPQSREQILSIVGAMKQRDEIDSVILAGTELPLLLRGHETGGLTFLDTTWIHVTAAVEAIFSEWSPYLFQFPNGSALCMDGGDRQAVTLQGLAT